MKICVEFERLYFLSCLHPSKRPLRSFGSLCPSSPLYSFLCCSCDCTCDYVGPLVLHKAQNPFRNCIFSCRNKRKAHIDSPSHKLWPTAYKNFNSVFLLFAYCTGLLVSPSGISELDCATTKTDTAERSISIGRESLQVFFVLGTLAYFQVPPLGGSRDEKWRSQ